MEAVDQKKALYQYLKSESWDALESKVRQDTSTNERQIQQLRICYKMAQDLTEEEFSSFDSDFSQLAVKLTATEMELLKAGGWWDDLVENVKGLLRALDVKIDGFTNT